MILKNTVLFCFDLDEIKGHPNEIIKQLKPDNAIDFIWIPRTVLSQVWWWIEFKDQDDKWRYEAFIKGSEIWVKRNDFCSYGETRIHISSMMNRDWKWLTQEEMDKWTEEV